LSPDEDRLFALDGEGELQATFDIEDAGLLDPQAMVFAPSSSTADGDDELNLFVADAGDEELLGGITEVTLVQVAALDTPTVTGQLAQTIDTSLWEPASPDPSGVTYLPATDRLTVVDSEVNEVTGAGYNGVNVWESSRTGVVARGWTTLDFDNDEPTGVGHDPATNTLFISTDTGDDRIDIVQAGADGLFGTGDDVRSVLDTNVLGLTDTEDPVFDPASGDLFFVDGVSTTVYRVDPVDGIFGNGNDTVTSFGVGQYGPTDTEAMALDQARGTLLLGDRARGMIYEVTKTGELVRTIDVDGLPGLRMISGMTTAPASNGSGQSNVWIADRGIDNGADPNENDGKLFEIALPVEGNSPPVIGSVTITPDQPKTNDTLTASATATDADGDELSSTYQWFNNGIALAGETSSTLELSVPGNGSKGDPISVRVTVSDGKQSAQATSAQVTIVNTAPVFDPPLTDRTDAEGASINLVAAAIDADDDPLGYEATGLPPGTSIDATSGTITGTIAAGAATASPYEVAVTARDDPAPTDPQEPGPPIEQVQRATANQSGVYTLSATFEAAPTVGNLLVAFGHYSANRTPTIPEGWTPVLESNTSGETVAFYRIAGANEPAQVTLAASGAEAEPPQTALNMSLTIFEYAGMHDVQAEVLDRSSLNSASAANSVSTGTTLITRHPNELLLASVGLNVSRTFDNAWTNGFVQQTDGARQTTAQRITSSIGQFETTETWTGTPAGTAVGSLLAFRGATQDTTTPDPNPGSVTDTFTWTVQNAAPPPGPAPAGCHALSGDWNDSGEDGLGWWCNGRAKLRTSGGDLVEYFYGRAGDIPLVADWDGDGQDTISVIRDGTWHVNNELRGGSAERSFVYGRVSRGDVPITGAWDYGTRDLPGIVRDREWHLRDAQSGGPADWRFVYGRLTAGDLPLVGDWNGDRRDTVGVVRQGEWLLRNRLAGGPADLGYVYGRVNAGDVPLTGDWTGDGTDTPAIVRNGRWYLKYEHGGGTADRIITFGAP
jgi:hypothetical protein